MNTLAKKTTTKTQPNLERDNFEICSSTSSFKETDRRRGRKLSVYDYELCTEYVTDC